MVFFFVICILCCNVDTTDNKYREKILNFIGKKSIGYSTLIFQKNPKLCLAWLRFETRNKHTHIDKNMMVWVSSFLVIRKRNSFLPKLIHHNFIRNFVFRCFLYAPNLLKNLLFVCAFCLHIVKKREQIYFCDGRKNNGSHENTETEMKKTQDKTNIEMDDNIDVQSL